MSERISLLTVERAEEWLLKPGVYFMQGNIASAEAALIAGCRFSAGYPITPSNEIAEHMARRLPQVGGYFIQFEDEIASINAIIGAAYGGVKSMTATSGPGFSLMQEAIGLAAMIEAPVVIVDVRRAGPSTGIPTLVGQGDIMQAKWGSHGDYEVVAFLPNSVQEMFDLTIEAFNTAWEYRVPVIVISDQTVGQMIERLRVPPLDEIKVVREDLDMIVIAPPVEPPEGLDRLAKILGVEVGKYGFLKPRTPWSPVETTRPGIYMCGSVAEPKDISDSVQEAGAAVAMALQSVEELKPPERLRSRITGAPGEIAEELARIIWELLR